METEFYKELENLINRHSMENDSNTPDFILAKYLANCLKNFNEIVNDRERWYGRLEYELFDTQLEIPYIYPDTTGITIPNNVRLGIEIPSEPSKSTAIETAVNSIHRLGKKNNFSPEIREAIQKLNEIGDRLLKQIENLKK